MSRALKHQQQIGNYRLVHGFNCTTQRDLWMVYSVGHCDAIGHYATERAAKAAIARFQAGDMQPTRFDPFSGRQVAR